MPRAYELGSVHRDLEPENIFLVRNDEEETATDRVGLMPKALEAWALAFHGIGHGCKRLPRQRIMFAKEVPLDDHHHHRL
jgi:hypothetical protein